ncbi:hypothetical protein [Streptomyces violascens]|uniref:hypothetical protein n=1 Tax=Streptomyces violascens TaxID=67381 RepID=UPI00365DEAD9
MDLQARHDEAATRVGELRSQIEHLTAALTETEARLGELATARKTTAELVPAGVEAEPGPPETSTAYQAIVNAFDQHPSQVFKARELPPAFSGQQHHSGARTSATAMQRASQRTESRVRIAGPR